MAALTETTQPDVLRQLLRYDPDTGKLFWKKRPLELFPDERAMKTWNTRYSGTEAFVTWQSDGYRTARIFGVRCSAHRIAWAIHYGAYPNGLIDHINGDPSDNRIVNLREADNAQNGHNKGPQSNNTSGYKGVHWSARTGAWQARIANHGKSYFLGAFPSPQEAHAAYCHAAKRIHGEFARTK